MRTPAPSARIRRNARGPRLALAAGMLRYPSETNHLTAELTATPEAIWGGTLIVASVDGRVLLSAPVTSSSDHTVDVTDAVLSAKSGGVSVHAVRTSGSGKWSLRMTLSAFHGGARVAEDKYTSETDTNEKLVMISFRAKD